MELVPNAVVNLGVGIPEKVAAVAGEEGLADQLILTTESGMIGGIPSGGGSFGAGVNGWAELPEVSQAVWMLLSLAWPKPTLTEM